MPKPPRMNRRKALTISTLAGIGFSNTLFNTSSAKQATSPTKVSDCSGDFAREFDRFHCLLQVWSAAADRNDTATIADVENEVAHRYEAQRAILILDLGGFSNISRSIGIIGATALIREVWKVFRPIVTKNGGETVKHEADTLYALISSMTNAVAASLAMEKQLAKLAREIRSRRGTASPVFEALSIGIGFGKVIRIGDARSVEEAYGTEVNYAYGAGEETAEHGEILLTQSAKEQLQKETSGTLPPGITAIAEKPQNGYSLWNLER